MRDIIDRIDIGYRTSRRQMAGAFPGAAMRVVRAAIWSGVMHGESLIVFLIVGVIAGWLAGVIMRGGGFGLIGDLVVGVVGAFIAGLILPNFHLHLGPPIVSSIIFALIGAIILLLIVRLVRRV